MTELGDGASCTERQFWLLQTLAPETRAYHVGSVFRIRGALDAAALRGAFEDLVARHAALRSTFEARDGDLRRRVHATLPPEFEEVARAVEPDGEEVAAELRRPFDLARGPLVRVRLWRAAPGDAVLAWTMHHVVSDLATKAILSAELGARYAARRAGPATPPAPAPEAEQITSVARWERGWRSSDAARRAEEYFAAHLGGAVPPLALPQARPRPAVQSHRGAVAAFALGPALTAQLERAAADWETKPFLVLLAAWALLLSRYAGEDRIAIGVPFSNRRREACQATVGCLVNTLPVLVDRGGDPPFRELVRRLRATFLGHHRHQELPLERLVARSCAGRDPSRNPLYQAGFTFEPPVPVALDGAEVTSLKAHAGGAQLDVFMTAWRAREGFEGRLEYCTDLFDPAAVERWLRSYRALLESVLEPGAAETIPVSRLRILDAAERELVLRTFNATERSYAGPHRLDDLFLAQAARTPDAPALGMGDRWWTYRELQGHALALARRLRASGVHPGDRVAVYLERSFELVTAILATVLAGAAYVPIDPEHPAHRVQLMAEDARPRCVLTCDALARAWPVAGVPAVPVRCDAPAAASAPLDSTSSPDDPAYVIFTSGSTGRPKGVANGHRGVVNRILWMQEAFRLGPSDLVLQKTPCTFDVSVWELFWPLCVGSRLEIAPPGVHRDPGALAALIQRAAVTTVHFVPSMLLAFLEHPDAGRCRTLRRVVCSGEALGAPLARRCCALLDAELDNLYGPTEAAVDVTWWRCRGDLGRDPVPIGRPIANTRLYVLDPHGVPTPVGVPGELHIGGVQVALGYVNRPELTRERFVPDPFASDPAARLYRTGDRARWNDDGTIDFLGRLDLQLKIRGVRVELEEIEAVLGQHPQVQQAVVVARPAPGGDSRLVAYVLPRDGGAGSPPLADALRAHAAARLPSAMVPQQLVVVDRLPFTTSGKIDRRALPDAPAGPAPSGRPPRNDVERWLQEECGALLNGRIGLQDNLFEAGGTSLVAAQLATRIRSHFGVELPVVRVFEHPTVEALSAHVAAQRGGGADQADPLEKARERAERRRARRPGSGPERG